MWRSWRAPSVGAAAGEPPASARVPIPATTPPAEGEKRGFPYPPAFTSRPPVAVTPEEALRQKAKELRLRRRSHPREVARWRAVDRGLEAVMEHRYPVAELSRTSTEEFMQAFGGDSSPEKKLAYHETMSRLTKMNEARAAYTEEWNRWIDAEDKHAEELAMREIQKNGGELPPETAEPETGPETAPAQSAPADPALHPGYRAAADLMTAGDFPAARRAFTALAAETEGSFQELAAWNLMLCALAAGEESAADTAAAGLLRRTAGTASFAMAALAMRDNEWAEVQIWLDQAADKGDPAENESLAAPLRKLGWLRPDTLRAAPPD